MIEVLYKCRCMPKEAAVEVRERLPDEDIVYWMERVVGLNLGAHHANNSPHCKENEMEYAKVPAPENAPGFGMAPKLDS